MPKTILLISLLLLCSTIMGCFASGAPAAAPSTVPTAEPTAAPVAEQTVAPLSDLEPPPTVGAEGPLQGAAVEIPETWIVPALLSKGALASYLKTTPEQIDWINPGLVDPVAPGTLIAIPSSYRVSAGESLSSVAAATGLSEDVLRAANPKLSAGNSLPEGTVLAVPPVIVMEATTLSAAATSLNLSGAQLLSVNPNLVGSSAIQTGTVLILPPKAERP